MSPRNLSVLATALITAAALPALAAPAFVGDTLRSNGALSRHAWTPAFAQADIAGWPVSAGLVLGLQGSIRTQLDRTVAPGLRVDLQGRSNLTLLAAGRRGTMLVWQRSN